MLEQIDQLTIVSINPHFSLTAFDAMAESDNLLPLLNGIEVEAALSIPVAKENDSLHWLADQFTKVGLNIAVEESNFEKTDYTTWKLTPDGSVPTDGTPYEDQSGVELVSPPISVFDTQNDPQTQRQFEQIDEYIRTFRMDRSSPFTYRSAVTQECGLHIHFGLDKGQPIPFDVCMCLALIVVLYEPVINTLHHWNRTPIPGTQAWGYARSNRTGFQQNGHVCHGLVDWQEVRRRIFATRNLGPARFEALASLMGAAAPLDGEYRVLPACIPMPPSPWRSDSQPPENYGLPLSDKPRESTPTESMSWHQEQKYYKTDRFIEKYCPEETHTSGSSSDSSLEMDPSVFSPVPASETTPTWDQSATTNDQDSDRNRWSASSIYEHSIKFKLVRWNNLTRYDEGPKTIEFRQPAGTLDTKTMAFTMQFYTALIRAAERLAKKLPPLQNKETEEQVLPSVPDFPPELKEEGEGKEATLDGLLDLLELPHDSNVYWLARRQEEQLRLQTHLAGLDEAPQTCIACSEDAFRPPPDPPLEPWGDENS